MEWKFSCDRPVYQQIVEQIKGAILSGEFKPGQRIPSVRDLALQAGVNPNTMQRALQALEYEQILITAGTNGRFVTEELSILDQFKIAQINALARECAERFAAFGCTPSQAAEYMRQLDNNERESN